MPTRDLVIIHGWSDRADSFAPLARRLERRLGTNVHHISLGQYVSMDDEVRFDDVVTALNKAWTDHRLPRSRGSVDAIVHSTGGLVIRDWLNRHFKPTNAPIKHLVMLAPANFGSPLAHKGRAFIGRVFKGGFTKKEPGKPFQTGTHILEGLELASTYSWHLAERDRFVSGQGMYAAGRVLCSVLVGNTGYNGIRAIANEDGTDGTVRLSTANMNCARAEAVFPKNPRSGNFNVSYKLQPSAGRTAFGVLDGHTHASITLKDSRLRSKRDKLLLDMIVKGLTVSDQGFDRWCNSLDRHTAGVMAANTRRSAQHGFQNTVVRVLDQFDKSVDDYIVEFYEKDDDEGWFARTFGEDALKKVHCYSGDSSYRSLYVDCTELHRSINRVQEAVSVSLSAVPDFKENKRVGFLSFDDEDIGGIRIPKAHVDQIFRENRTILMTLRLHRHQSDEVFRFRALKAEN